MIYGFCGYGDSVEIPTGFSVGKRSVWGLKSNPDGSQLTSAFAGTKRQTVRTARHPTECFKESRLRQETSDIMKNESALSLLWLKVKG